MQDEVLMNSILKMLQKSLINNIKYTQSKGIKVDIWSYHFIGVFSQRLTGTKIYKANYDK